MVQESNAKGKKETSKATKGFIYLPKNFLKWFNTLN